MFEHHFLQNLRVRSQDFFTPWPNDIEHFVRSGLEEIDADLPLALALRVEVRRQMVVREEPQFDAAAPC